jgi:tRNA G10  N-methylase Trm11
MTQSVAILGRQTALGLAELESLFGAEKITTLGIHAAQIDAAPVDVDIHRLGGSLRIAKLLTYLPYTDWKNLERYITQELPKHVTYGFNVSPAQINASALAMKKVVKNAGRSIRVIPNKEAELNTAQVLHNKLAEQPLGMELLLIKDGQRTVLAQTAAVQDIEAYAARDQARPKRDAKVGMLPPKLAQIVLNLAVNENTQSVLDPFCGTGVILQEALLMGYDAYGTDLEDRMIDYSSANLEWLAEKRDFKGQTYLLETGDATTYEWQEFDTIACETYLGRPFSAPPAGHILDEVIQDVDTIHRKFLKNVARQSKTGFKMTIAVPAWKTTKGFKHLKTLDSLEELGYTRVSFVHVLNSDLIYHRENQIVARELVTIVRK